MTREEFTKTYYPTAQSVTAGTGLFPETAIVQAILESSAMQNGTWEPGASKLSAVYNNFFGIKAGSSWGGPTVNLVTGEYNEAGQPYSISDSFRVYSSPEESFRDWKNLLTQNTRYANVLRASNPYEQFQRLKEAGYATDPNYTGLLTSVYNSIKNYIPKATGTALILMFAVVTAFFF